MATFTMYLKDVDRLTEHHIGLDVYPIFDEQYRTGLNTKILEHFYNREIGYESIDLFVFAMRRKMNEIMPLHNQLYLSARKDFDPFTTFTSSGTSTTDGTSETVDTRTSNAQNTSESDAASRTVASDTPQTRLSGDEDYATSATDSNSKATTTGSATTQDSGKQTGTQGGTTTSSAHGMQGSPSELMLQWRQTFLNIDMLVIQDLEPLFMQLWSNGDEFTPDANLSAYTFGYGVTF